MPVYSQRHWRLLMLSTLGWLLAACLPGHGGAAAPGFSRSGGPTSVPTADVASHLATQTAQGAWSNFGYGARVSLGVDAADAILNGVAAMRFNWLALDVSWKSIEPAPGEYHWETLNAALGAVEAHPTEFQVLLTVGGAPDWARPAGADLTLDGPPADLATFGNFLATAAGRYQGRIAAYEIWPEPNLCAHWSTPTGLSGSDYVQLLRTGYTAVKTGDPMAIVVSGGLAPTPQNDGLESVDDLTFLKAMYAAGAAQAFDALGVHLDGRDNPPNERSDQPATTRGYSGQSAYYFRQFEDIRATMVAAGDEAHSLWLTGVGWASADPAPPGLDYASRNTEADQAAYLVEAVSLARRQPYITSLFIDNFNLAMFSGAPRDAAFGLIRQDWTARPAFLAVARLRQTDVISAQVSSIPSGGTLRAALKP